MGGGGFEAMNKMKLPYINLVFIVYIEWMGRNKEETKKQANIKYIK